jgi:hypothetical protein
MDSTSNSGVEGGSGYSFQKCCIVMLLLEGFQELKNKNYFICVEHYEDFLFGYLTDSGELKYIDTYQAKKSRNDWTTNNELCEIVGKITKVGNEIMKDPFPKCSTYHHSLHFITNKNIKLSSKKIKGIKQNIVKVQVSNDLVDYSALDKNIKTNISSKICSSYRAFFSELKNLKFQFIDLPQSNKGWYQVLESLSREVLGKNIEDHQATVTTLIKLLQDIELTYNNNHEVLLSDNSKKLTKDKIMNTFSIFEEYKKSFTFWREHSQELAESLSLKLPIQRKAEELLRNCFDYFKDLKQPEYRKIYKFVESSTDIDEKHSSESECISEIYDVYMKENMPRLAEHMVAFSVIAAYVESRGIYD